MKHVAEAKVNLKKLRDAEMILKTKKTTTVEKRALVAAQQNSYDAGDELLTAAFKGNTSKTQKLLSAPGVQSYINYTDADGRTPLFQAAWKRGAAPPQQRAQVGPPQKAASPQSSSEY